MQLGSIQHKVCQFITCRSDFVVKVLFCPCRFYIGKTIHPLFKRIREHIYSLKTEKCAPRFISRMHEKRGGDYTTLWFAGLQRLFNPKNGTDGHKVLLQPEPRWIFDTNALGPLGLNDRNKLSSFLM